MTECFAETDSPSFSFILMPEFSLMALTAVIEPLRHANDILGKEHYSWAVYSETGTPVSSSSRVEINPKGDLDAIDLGSTVVLCGGPNVIFHTSAKLLCWLRRAARHLPMIGGLCTASRVLAEAGVLDGYKATIHWESLDAFRESFSRVSVSENLFEIDRDRFTCAGETAGIDMMVTLLAARHGNLLAARVAEQVLHTRVRPQHEGQRLTLQVRLGARSPHLIHAVQLMESRIEEPLDVSAIIREIGCSRRQLERNFKKYLRCPPMVFYRNLRLDRARGLLLETDLKYTEISVACGFKSFGSFSRTYRDRFGQTPRDEKGMPKLNSHIVNSPIITHVGR
jgi:AraC family transcriptional regulator, glycine betaine-responsive activator